MPKRNLRERGIWQVNWTGDREKGFRYVKGSIYYEKKLSVQGTTYGSIAGNQSVKDTGVVGHKPRKVMRNQIMLKSLKFIP